MTRLRRIALGGAAAALIMTGAASKSFADEPGTFDNRLFGATVGAPLGAAPPPGLYAGFENLWAPQVPGAASKGNQTGAGDISALVAAVPVVWATGWNVFGGNWVVSVVQGWYLVGAGPQAGPLAGMETSQAYFTNIGNTVLNPITLSWNLGQGWFGSVGFTFMGPDGSHWATSTGHATTTPDYWTYEVDWALSYISGNWVGSANFFYDFNGTSSGHCCAGAGMGVAPFNGWTPGQQLYIDAFLAYKLGKWEFGPVAFLQRQTTNDSPGVSAAAPLGCAAVFPGTTQSICGQLQRAAIGGLVGYDFGPVDVHVWVTYQPDGWQQNCAGCSNALDFWSSLGFKIWGPEAPAPKPLVAKN